MTCARCRNDKDVATYTIRAEQLCADCLAKYVTSKVVKRLETCKVRGNYGEKEKVILLPVTCGASSLSLLHVLDTGRRERLSRNRPPGYTLHLLHVDESPLTNDGAAHTAFRANIFDSFKQPESPFSSYQFTTLAIEKACNVSGPDTTPSQSLQDLVSTCRSATNLSDLRLRLRTSLIESFAHTHDCDSILYADTSTALAEKVLALTAKGQGSLVPTSIADRHLDSGVFVCYPLRDLLDKEIALYAGTAHDPSLSLDGKPLFHIDGGVSGAPSRKKDPPNSRDLSIDALMHRYFQGVESNHPSVVANVVRTAGKLDLEER